ncbi:MAG: ABC transporter permease [Flavobacteriales bacterium]|nr:ABC transporter permease [Flavobacteriales bacterium]
MTVVAFITAAMICVMSIFNGIEQLVQDLFANFDAPLTIVPAEGKFFADSLITDAQLQSIPGLASYSRVVEEDAWINFGDRNGVATIKGIDADYAKQSSIASMMYAGVFELEKDSFSYAIPGLAVCGDLDIPLSIEDPAIININAPIRGKKLSRYREAAFNQASIIVQGAFSVNAELDARYVFVPLSFAREIFEMDSVISAIEINLVSGASDKDAADQLATMLPSALKVQSRYEKNALIYQTNASEKWATFLILVFILLIACFNISASLTMLIIEKKHDISILSSIGATPAEIRQVFILEGVFINGIGAVAGVVIGLSICALQENYGLIRMEGAMVEFYPVLVKAADIIGIFLTVLVTGSLFSLVLVRALMKRFVGVHA